eukprot:s1083_g6.t1
MLPWLLSQSQSFYDLAYADDTAIFTGTTERGQQVLHKIQEVRILRAHQGEKDVTDWLRMSEIHLRLLDSAQSSRKCELVPALAPSRGSFVIH